MSYERFEHEGGKVPAPANLAEVLCGPAEIRAWLIRAAVTSEPLAKAVAGAAAGLLEAPGAQPIEIGVALLAARALCARGLVGPVVDALERRPSELIGVADPTDAAGGTLAQSALAFVAQTRTAGDRAAGDVLRRALAVPELRRQAWQAVGGEDWAGPLPWLLKLLAAHPDLVPQVALCYAVIHTPHCEAAARVLAALPHPLRRAFAAELERELRRIRAIHTWARCRHILLG